MSVKNIIQCLVYTTLSNIAYVMADGLPLNPPAAPTPGPSWITVPVINSVPQSASGLPVVPAATNQIGNSFFEPVHTEDPEVQHLLVSHREDQIGNSFFESANYIVVPISQVGVSYEDRNNLSDIYVFYNHLFSNNIFTEARVYGAYNYNVVNPNFPSLQPSNQANQPGYGFVGILGYNIPLNSNVSLMPFIRLSYYNDFFAVYTNSSGDSINSNQYMAQGGARLSLKVNNVFAVYASYWIGFI